MKLDRLHALYHQPLFDLISQSREIHLEHWRGEEVQRCSSAQQRARRQGKIRARHRSQYRHVPGGGFVFPRWLGPFGEKSEAEISAHLIFPRARPYLIARRMMKVI
jgi:hypothetical protein